MLWNRTEVADHLALGVHERTQRCDLPVVAFGDRLLIILLGTAEIDHIVLVLAPPGVAAVIIHAFPGGTVIAQVKDGIAEQMVTLSGLGGVAGRRLLEAQERFRQAQLGKLIGVATRLAIDDVTDVVGKRIGPNLEEFAFVADVFGNLLEYGNRLREE